MGLLSKKDNVASSLPYGEQRLLELGRALALDPSLMLLDEPAAGLNSHETALLRQKIRDLKSLGITIFLVEHDMNLVMKVADEIIVIDHGKKLAQGTPQAIRNDPRVISAYLGDRKEKSVG